jgi:hypothetical protein
VERLPGIGDTIHDPSCLHRDLGLLTDSRRSLGALVINLSVCVLAWTTITQVVINPMTGQYEDANGTLTQLIASKGGALGSVAPSSRKDSRASSLPGRGASPLPMLTAEASTSKFDSRIPSPPGATSHAPFLSSMPHCSRRVGIFRARQPTEASSLSQVRF